MKAHLIDTHLVKLRQRSLVKFKYQGHTFPKTSVLVGISVSQTQLVQLEIFTDNQATAFGLSSGALFTRLGGISPYISVISLIIILLFYLQIAFILMLINYTTPDYGDGYVYSSSAIAIGMFIGLVPEMGLIFHAVKAILERKGTFLQVKI